MKMATTTTGSTSTSIPGIRRSKTAASSINSNRMSTTSSSSLFSSASLLINLDIFIQKVKISRESFPSTGITGNEKLFVLLKRNGKEIKSEATKWDKRDIAVWNQHLDFQTNLIRTPSSNSSTSRHSSASTSYTGTSTTFLKKEYEIILITYPSMEKIAFFKIDISQIVQPTKSRYQSFHLSPIQCLDRNAFLEFQIKWDYANPPHNTVTGTAGIVGGPETGSGSGSGRLSRFLSVSSMENISELVPSGAPPAPQNQNHPLHPHHRTSQSRPVTSRSRSGGSRGSGNDPNYPLYTSSMYNITSTNVAEETLWGTGGGYHTSSTSSSLGGDTTTTSSSTRGSSNKCQCSTLRRQVEKKELQLTQAEFFIKEFQKKIDILTNENEALRIQEQAETRHGIQHRTLSIRLLQELEMVYIFCMERIRNGLGLIRRRHEEEEEEEEEEENEEEKTMTTSVTLENLQKFIPEVQVMQKIQRLYQDFQQIQQAPSSSSSDVSKQQEIFLLWQQFDLFEENEKALERNQFLHQQLVLLHEELSEEIYSQSDEENKFILTSRTRINQLERETILLRKKLQNAETLLANTPYFSRTSTSSSTASGNGNHMSTIVSSNGQQQQQGGKPYEVTLKQKLEKEKEELEEKEEEEDEFSRGMSSIYPNSMRISIASGTIPIPTGTNGLMMMMNTSGGSGGSCGLGIGETGLEMIPSSDQEELLKEIEELKEDKEKLLNDMKKLQEEVSTLKIHATTMKTINSSDTSKVTPPFFNKMFMDMNMAKVMLEERVKDLTTQLQEAQETNFQMDQKIKDLQTNPIPLQPKQSLSAKDNFDTIPNPSSKITELEAVNSKLQKEINTLQTQLMQAQQNKSLPEEEGKMSETHTNSVDLSLTDPAIAIVDLQKQLKLSKQEAMQLRFRSNNLERVHEKLEETLKENKALEVKLTTLEGQLFEQRHRTISQSQSQNLENGFELDEKTKELNQKTAQLIVCERELEFVKKELDEIKKRDPSNQLIVAVSNSNGQEEFLVQNLNDKLMSLQEKLVQLTQENQDQAKKIEVFYTNLQQTNQEKIDLQRIMDQMVNESQQLEQIIQQERQQYLQAMCIMENSSHHNEKMPSPTATFTNALTPPIKTSRVSELMKIFK